MRKGCLLLFLFVLLLGSHAGAAPPTQIPPPLVLEPNRYSYTFGMPEGWDFSFDHGRAFGIPLVFFPQGGSFRDSITVIYVNELCRANCTEALDAVIEKTMNDAKKHSPSLTVTTAQPLNMNEGGVAPVRVLTGSRDPRQAREALAFIGHKEVVVLVILTAKDTKTWESDYKAFAEIVGGHRFFNCDASGLAVPCR